MNIHFTLDTVTYSADLSNPLDISIPLQEGSQNPNCYYAENPSFQTIRFGETFVGSVAEGGACNYQKLTITPHGNGTHTECYGHLNNQEKNLVTIHQSLKKFWFVARLISIIPTKITEEDLNNKSFQDLKEIAAAGDEVILQKDIEEEFNRLDDDSLPFEALIIRTLPNDTSKKAKQYSGTNPPYLEPSIGAFLAKENINHLLLDLPSVDRESDKGKLSVHKGFWNILEKDGAKDFSKVRKSATITELVFVDNAIQDGVYLLNLQIPSLEIDATPSKPVLYKML